MNNDHCGLESIRETTVRKIGKSVEAAKQNFRSVKLVSPAEVIERSVFSTFANRGEHEKDLATFISSLETATSPHPLARVPRRKLTPDLNDIPLFATKLQNIQKRHCSSSGSNVDKLPSSSDNSPASVSPMETSTGRNKMPQEKLDKCVEATKYLMVDTSNDNPDHEPEDDGFIILPSYAKLVNSNSEEKDTSKLVKSCIYPSNVKPKPKDDIQVFIECLEYKLRKISDPKTLCLLKRKIDDVLFEAEMEQYDRESQLSADSTDSSTEFWRSTTFRKKVADKIYEIMRRYDIHCIKTSTEMEEDEFIKAKTQEEYLTCITELILHLFDTNSTSENITKHTDSVNAVRVMIMELAHLCAVRPETK